MINPEARSAQYNDDVACFQRLLDITNVTLIARFTIDGDPASKARPRFDGRGIKSRVYTPAKTRDAERVVAWRFREAAPKHRPDADHEYGLACVFFQATQQRRDVDNMLKLISDGLNGVAWADDAQVSEVTGRRGCDLPANARTEVLVYRMGKRRYPTRNCKRCGTPFRISPSTKKVYCSSECVYADRRKERTCQQCGKKFVAKASEADLRNHCSKECRSMAGRVTMCCEICGDQFSTYRSWQRKNAYCSKPECARAIDARRQSERRTRHFPGKCLICGAGTTRKEYKRCNVCKRASLPLPDPEVTP